MGSRFAGTSPTPHEELGRAPHVHKEQIPTLSGTLRGCPRRSSEPARQAAAGGTIAAPPPAPTAAVAAAPPPAPTAAVAAAPSAALAAADGASSPFRYYKHDRLVGTVTLAWPLFMLKYSTALSWSENAQWAGMVFAVVATLLLWPMLHRRSYQRWRTPAVIGLRLLCFTRPFVFSLTWFDTVAPCEHSGTLGLLQGCLQLMMAGNVTLLVFCSVAAHLPFRLHAALQAGSVALMACLGLRPLCGSKLLTGPLMRHRISSLHVGMGMIATPLTPLGAALVPQGEPARCATLLLLCWLLLGWLLPTLLLLRETPSGQGGLLGAQLEAFLRFLRYPPSVTGGPQQQQQQQQWQQRRHEEQQGEGEEQPAAGDARVLWLVHWWAVVVISWAVCGRVSEFIFCCEV